MNIVMIYPCQGNMVTFNYGAASVIAMLKKSGHSVMLIMVRDHVKDRDIIRRIEDFKADVIGFSCMSNYWQYVKDLSKKIKSRGRLKDIPIFVGGPHAIVCASSIIESRDIEGFCIGEGEYAFPELVGKIEKGIDFRDTRNFYFNDANGVIRNEMRTLIDDLDELPFPDREVFPEAAFTNYANFTFSRGCPFSCSYCCNSAFHVIFKGKGRMIRHRSAENAIREIEAFLKNHKPRLLSFDDDCFNKNAAWFREFCSKYKERIGIPYTCNTRPELLDAQAAEALKDSGCRKINIGIESGDERLRRTVLNRNMKDEDIERAFRNAREAGLETMSFNMIGIPGDTRETIRKTMEFNKKIRPTYSQVSVFYPYAGTPLGELCREKRYIENENSVFNFFRGSSVLRLPGLSKKEIEDLFIRFDIEVNHGGEDFARLYRKRKMRNALLSVYGRMPSFLKNIMRLIKRRAVLN
ncbi:MAG: radical SAM protein [Candidatus Omnitrophota bacterium]